MVIRGVFGVAAAMASTTLLVGILIVAVASRIQPDNDLTLDLLSPPWITPKPAAHIGYALAPTSAPAPAQASDGPRLEDAKADKVQMDGSIGYGLVEVSRRVAPGQTLDRVLRAVGVSERDAVAAVQAVRSQYDLRKLKAGQEVLLTVAPDHEGSMSLRLSSLRFAVDFPNRVVVDRSKDGTFSASLQLRAVERASGGGSGIIRSSLFADGSAAGVPRSILATMLKVFAWDIDFQRDFRGGERFAALYSEYVDDAGDTVRGGTLIAAALVLHGKTRVLFRHKSADGHVDYYDSSGRSARKALLRTPVDGARLSSGFGMRRHPILGYSRMHKGVDFAAPTGTPIFAAGDGVVEYRGRRGGYGNYIRIRHRSGYSTAYAHMSRYGRSIKKGTRVKQGQVIGYVGTTGRSTGPHLHFEILLNGKHINPKKVKVMPGPRLGGSDLKRFKRAVATLEPRLQMLIATADRPKLTPASN